LIFKQLRRFLIWTGVWGRVYPPMNIYGVLVHRPWPWKPRPLTADEIVSVQPMTSETPLLHWKKVKEETHET
jgi:hypothetical protein